MRQRHGYAVAPLKIINAAFDESHSRYSLLPHAQRQSPHFIKFCAVFLIRHCSADSRQYRRLSAPDAIDAGPPCRFNKARADSTPTSRFLRLGFERHDDDAMRTISAASLALA